MPLLITGAVQAPSYGLDSEALTGKVQEQVKENMKEAMGDLLKGSTRPDDLKRKGRDLLKGLLGHQEERELKASDRPLLTTIMFSHPHSLRIRIRFDSFSASLWQNSQHYRNSAP